jgi:hypothetical protein
LALSTASLGEKEVQRGNPVTEYTAHRGRTVLDVSS